MKSFVPHLVLCLAACGGTAERVSAPSRAEPAAAAQPARQDSLRTEIDGRAFEARDVALHLYEWDTWEIRLGDGATVVRVGAGEHIPIRSVAREPMVAMVDVVPPDGMHYVAIQAGTFEVRDVELAPGDAALAYPQPAGRALVQMDVEIPARDGHGAGRIEGRAVVPIVLERAPDEVCRASAPAPTEVAWTDAPTIAAATGDTIHGAVHGRGFTASSIYVAVTGSTWGLVATTGAGPAPSAGTEGVELLSDAPLRAGLHTQPMGSPSARLHGCDAVYRARELGDHGAYAIELTSVRVGRCALGSDGLGRRGTASGRVVAMFRGGEVQSWIAGTFTDAPVVSESCR